MSSVIEWMLELEPLVETDIVHITPAELIQNRREPTNMYMDDLYGADPNVLGPRPKMRDLPQALQDYCNKTLMVWPAKVENRRTRIA